MSWRGGSPRRDFPRAKRSFGRKRISRGPQPAADADAADPPAGCRDLTPHIAHIHVDGGRKDAGKDAPRLDRSAGFLAPDTRISPSGEA